MAARTRLTHVDERGRIRMVDVGDKAVTAREATASGHVSMSPAARAAIRSGTLEEGQPARSGAARRHHGRQAHGRDHSPVPSPGADRHRRRGDADVARGGDPRPRPRRRPDRRRDGGAHRRRRRRPHRLRHGQGRGQGDGHRPGPARGEVGRPVWALPSHAAAPAGARAAGRDHPRLDSAGRRRLAGTRRPRRADPAGPAAARRPPCDDAGGTHRRPGGVRRRVHLAARGRGARRGTASAVGAFAGRRRRHPVPRRPGRARRRRCRIRAACRRRRLPSTSSPWYWR